MRPAKPELMNAFDTDLRVAARERQRDEITEHHIYRRLVDSAPESETRQVLTRLADDELRHYRIWKKVSGVDVPPSRVRVFLYAVAARVLGLTFTLKLMESGEKDAQSTYEMMTQLSPEAAAIKSDEQEHETALLRLLDEERLRYMGSIVLGLNDALVELVGALAGLTFALRNARLISATGLVTGVAAALSMAASEYLSTLTERGDRHPIRAALYTGSTYLVTVILLILPYLCLQNYFLSLILTLIVSLLVIAGFTFYIAVAQEKSFLRHFLEMAAVSFGVAAISLLIGNILRRVVGVDI